MGRGVNFYGSEAFSKMTWTDTREELSLSLDFANDIFRGAFASHFAPTIEQLRGKLQAFYAEMGKLFPHVVTATYILVHDFFWQKFG